MRWYVIQSEHVAHAFATRHGLHPTDMAALIAVMEAEGAGQPLTPGALATRLRLSSAATTAVVDRLERAGHLRRDRDVADRRRIHLHFAPASMALAREFFGPLGRRANDLMAEFDDGELDTVLRFVDGMTRAMEAHRTDIEA